MLEHVRCKPERHVHSLGRKRKGGGYLERGVKIIVLPLSPCLCWPLLTQDTNSHRSSQPYFSLLSSQSIQHRQDNTAGRASRTAPCISAEPHALEHQGKDTTSPEKKLKSPGYVRDFSQMIIPWQVYS